MKSLRHGVALLGVLALAVLPACSPEDSGAPASEASASASSAAKGDGQGGGIADSVATRAPKEKFDKGHKAKRAKDESAAKDEDGDGTKTDADTEHEGKSTLHRVIRVVDGDTVLVDIHGGEKIRVIGMVH